MADVRIKDIVTTATAAANDDYAVLDGSTNGTRKILASALGGGGDIDFSTPHKIGTLGNDEVWEAYIVESDYSGSGSYTKTITFSDYGISGISQVLSIDGLAAYNDGWSFVMFAPNTSGSHRFENNGFNTSSISIYDPSQSNYKAILHLIYTKATS
jgi:hypothetical protein